MAQTQTQNQPSNPITYPSRIYDGTNFVVNQGMNQSSDNLTTVLTDKNEVLGFKDGTSPQEMQAAIDADRNGSISEYKPTFYEKYIQQPLAKLGMSAFQTPIVTDITPTTYEKLGITPRERAFVTSAAESVTLGIFKPEGVDQEATKYPYTAKIGSFAGGAIPYFLGIGALGPMKALTPFAENVAKTAIVGGTMSAVSRTAEATRTPNPDLIKVGEGVLKDTAFAATFGATSELSKIPQLTAQAGLGYVQARSEGQDVPSSLLSAGLFAITGAIQFQGNKPDVRDMAFSHVQQSIADYIVAKHPLVHPMMADQGGREMITNYSQDVIERANQRLLGENASVEKTGIETPQAKKIEEESNVGYPRPEKPIEDGYDPNLLNYLSQYIPADRLVRMSGTDRVALGKASPKDLESYRQQYEEIAGILAKEKAQAEGAKDVQPEVQRMENEGGGNGSYENVRNEVVSSPTLLKEIVQTIQKDVSGSNETPLLEEETPVEETKVPVETPKVSPKFPEDSTTFDEQDKLAEKLSIEDKRAILRGEKELPGKLEPGPLIGSIERYLKTHPDKEIAHELANSDILEKKISAAGRTLVTAKMREGDSYSAKMGELKKALEDVSKETPAKKAKIVKEAKESMDKINLSEEDLNLDKFLDEIKC